MPAPSGFGTQPFGLSTFGRGYRDITIRIGRGRSRLLAATGRPNANALTVTPRE